MPSVVSFLSRPNEGTNSRPPLRVPSPFCHFVSWIPSPSHKPGGTSLLVKVPSAVTSPAGAGQLGNVLCGSGLWEFQRWPFDSDRVKQFGKAAARSPPEGWGPAALIIVLNERSLVEAVGRNSQQLRNKTLI